MPSTDKVLDQHLPEVMIANRSKGDCEIDREEMIDPDEPQGTYGDGYKIWQPGAGKNIQDGAKKRHFGSLAAWSFSLDDVSFLDHAELPSLILAMHLLSLNKQTDLLTCRRP